MKGLLSTASATALPSLGLDIGTGVVKMIQAAQSGDRIDICAAASFEAPRGTLEGAVVSDPKRFGKALQQQLEMNRIGPSACVFSVPSGSAALRTVQLPLLDPDELREAARFKVRKHLPFPVEGAYVEASTPDVPDGESVGTSVVIAVPRAVIDSRAEAVEAANLTAVGAELEAQAILRIVERRLNQRSALWRDASLTIIDVGHNNTHMYVVQNQRLQFIRNVKFGAGRIAEAIAQSQGITPEEAEALLHAPETELWSEGVLKVKLGNVYQLVYISQEIDKLVREFLRLLRYFRSLHPERSYAGILDHVLICGGLAGLPGFAEYLEGALELRVERARPLSGMVAQLNKKAFETVANRQEAYTVSVGLALASLKEDQRTRRQLDARREYRWSRAG